MTKTNSYYEIILELKRFLHRAEELTKPNDLDVLISEVKNYIASTEELRIYYNNRISEHSTQKVVFKTIHRIILRVVREVILSNPLKHQERNIAIAYVPSAFYYSCLSEIMPNKIQAETTVAIFYFTNIYNYCIENKNFDGTYKQNFIQVLNKILSYVANKVGKTLDFSALLMENFLVYGRGVSARDEFYLNFIKSALIGVLYDLQNYIKDFLRKDNEIIAVDMENKFNNADILLPHLSLEGRLKDIFEELCKDNSLRASDLAEYYGRKTDTIQQQIREIAKRICGKGGKKEIIAYIKIHNLHKNTKS